MQLTASTNKFAVSDRFGNPIVVIKQNPLASVDHQLRELPHGQPSHVCCPVFLWQREFWGPGVHMERHDCLDGGCK